MTRWNAERLGGTISRRKTEYLDRASQEGRENTWIEHAKRELGRQKIEHTKKEDRMRGSNIPMRRTEDLQRTSHEGRQNTWIKYLQKEDGIPG
jgi:hypothetical protein